jgi:hypothetical protein
MSSFKINIQTGIGDVLFELPVLSPRAEELLSELLGYT